jgi:hypothetical protein
VLNYSYSSIHLTPFYPQTARSDAVKWCCRYEGAFAFVEQITRTFLKRAGATKVGKIIRQTSTPTSSSSFCPPKSISRSFLLTFIHTIIIMSRPQNIGIKAIEIYIPGQVSSSRSYTSSLIVLTPHTGCQPG